jgi:hypothetical protein
MFSAVLSNTIQNINSVKIMIELNDKIRDILLGDNTQYKNIRESISSPSIAEWRIYDHCSAITRLYAIYENFVEDILRNLIDILPYLYTYDEMPSGFRNEHRNGIAYILQRLDAPRYRGLAEEKIIEDYHNTLSGKHPYVFKLKVL